MSSEARESSRSVVLHSSERHNACPRALTLAVHNINKHVLFFVFATVYCINQPHIWVRDIVTIDLSIHFMLFYEV